MTKIEVISQKPSKKWIFGKNGHFLTLFGQKKSPLEKTGNTIGFKFSCQGVSRARENKRPDGMPEPNVIDKEFLLRHRPKVQKIYSPMFV